MFILSYTCFFHLTFHQHLPTKTPSSSGWGHASENPRLPAKLKETLEDLGFLDLFGNPTATNAPSWDPNDRVFEDTWDPNGRERCDSPSHFPSHFMAIFSYPLPMSNSILLRQSCATWTWGWASPSSAPRLQWCNLLEVQTLIVWLMTMMKE
jgi:hypothetical protein